jgi:translation initiation factor 5B
MASVFIDQETSGITLKCDTIGSLEAITEMLKREQISVAKADIGPVNRRDVVGAKAIKDKDRHLGVILSFNVKVLPDAKDEADTNHIRIFDENVIYNLIGNYSKWVTEDTTHEEDAIFAEFTPIAKFTFLKGYVFRNNDPAVFGIKVDVGTLRQKVKFVRMDGKEIGKIHQLQESGKTIESADTGKEVACSVQGITIGRQISEEDVFYSLPSSNEAKQLLKKYSHKLSSEQFNLLNEIVEIQRKKDPAYGY